MQTLIHTDAKAYGCISMCICICSTHFYQIYDRHWKVIERKSIGQVQGRWQIFKAFVKEKNNTIKNCLINN